MIHLSNSSIMTVSAEGIREVFEFEELQSRIYQSCISCGINDSLLAEDITLTVEYVLRKISGEEKIFTVSEINAFVLRILEDAGFSEVAENFRKNNKVQKLDIRPDFNMVSSLVAKYLGLSGGELELTSRKVASSFEYLRIDRVSPSLIIEMARYFKEKRFELETSGLSVPRIRNESPWCIGRDEILSRIARDSSFIFDSGIAVLGNVSRLFPALKVDVSLTALAVYEKVSKPATELGLLPCFKNASIGINDAVCVSRKLYSEYLHSANAQDGILPVYLRITDAQAFSSEYLNMSLHDGGAVYLNELISMLASMLDENVIIKNIPE